MFLWKLRFDLHLAYVTLQAAEEQGRSFPKPFTSLEVHIVSLHIVGWVCSKRSMVLELFNTTKWRSA